MPTRPSDTREGQRLREDTERVTHWKRWGPYLAERAWGTVREDYSPDGAAWEYFPHDHARSRAYRWNDDGIAGISDHQQHICFALALWNGRDPILKERLFGLTSAEGNHAEDVKECYFHLDSTPTHSFMRYLYKYPQAAFPYEELCEENRRRGRAAPEYELIDTGVFAGDRYFDVFVEYAKASRDDLVIEITAHNRGPEPARLHLLPTIWFRNTWSWDTTPPRPILRRGDGAPARVVVELSDHYYGERFLHCPPQAELLFTENETNAERLFGTPNPSPYVKDAFHEFVVHGRRDAVNPAEHGTKAAAHCLLDIPARSEARIRLRLTDRRWPAGADPLGEDFERVLATRREEADEFYAIVIPPELSADARNVMRRALAGMLWSKQFYHYEVERWLEGDPAQPKPPAARLAGRNHEWTHLYNADVLSMPDKWEYPWYAAWDLAFHCVVLTIVDAEFAKSQLLLLLREWYMRPNGQLPAYEWAFGDANPPVHAWAALRVYQIEKKRTGVGDRAFLARIFHKLMLTFTWWVNRLDVEGNNIFEGGFLGLDNIGPLDRSKPLPDGVVLEQSDGTSWMAMFALNMLAIAVELALEDPVYEDVASKFWEHFLYIAGAMQHRGSDGASLWSEEDGFFYDVVKLGSGTYRQIKVRSLVGLIPLFATHVLEDGVLERLPGFKRRMDWFLENRPELTGNVSCATELGQERRQLLSAVKPAQLARILRYMLDESEFLSPHGVRSLSRKHLEQPWTAHARGQDFRVDYEPAESSSGLFGGNSNWRGPVWMPVNYLVLEALQRFAYHLGDGYRVECPTGSGRLLTLDQVTVELARRLVRLFLRDGQGRRPVNGGNALLDTDPHWRDLILFHEYFHGDTGAGLGASHQTGWTGLVAKLLQQSGALYAREDDRIAASASWRVSKT